MGDPSVKLVYRVDTMPAKSSSITMKVQGGPGEHPDKARYGNWGIFITRSNKQQATKFRTLEFMDQINGCTIAHEIGHVMNLIHRGKENDSIGQIKNVMAQFRDINPPAQPLLSMDIDLIQLDAARRSEALK